MRRFGGWTNTPGTPAQGIIAKMKKAAQDTVGEGESNASPTVSQRTRGIETYPYSSGAYLEKRMQLKECHIGDRARLLDALTPRCSVMQGGAHAPPLLQNGQSQVV